MSTNRIKFRIPYDEPDEMVAAEQEIDALKKENARLRRELHGERGRNEAAANWLPFSFAVIFLLSVIVVTLAVSPMVP